MTNENRLDEKLQDIDEVLKRLKEALAGFAAAAQEIRSFVDDNLGPQALAVRERLRDTGKRLIEVLSDFEAVTGESRPRGLMEATVLIEALSDFDAVPDGSKLVVLTEAVMEKVGEHFPPEQQQAGSETSHDAPPRTHSLVPWGSCPGHHVRLPR